LKAIELAGLQLSVREQVAFRLGQFGAAGAVFVGGGDQDLVDGVGGVEDTVAVVGVELGQDVVEEQDGRVAGGLGGEVDLGEAEGEGGGALLTS